MVWLTDKAHQQAEFSSLKTQLTIFFLNHQIGQIDLFVFKNDVCHKHSLSVSHQSPFLFSSSAKETHQQ
jgi:hypothetical protein